MEITKCVPCIKSKQNSLNKTVYASVIDSYNNVRRRSTPRTVGIVAEIYPKIIVEMLEALQSVMLELENIIIFWSAAQAFVDEIVSIIVKCMVHITIVVSTILYEAEA